MNGTEKLRVAVGVFHDIASLRLAVDDLLAAESSAGAAEGDIILLCDNGAMRELLHDPAGPVSDLKVRIFVRNGKDGPVHNGPDIDEPASNLSDAQILHFETWIDFHLADHLDHQLKRGGCLLLCPALSAESEKTVSNVLLRHSAEPVQLHDIRPAG